MPSHRRLNAALDNTLAILASQNTRWQGYVLLGFLDPDAPTLTFDLLHPPTVDVVDVVTHAHVRAARVFDDQCRKQHVDGLATAASLTLAFSDEPTDCWGRSGRVLTLTARAASRHAEYTRTHTVCVWRHDPSFEGYSDHG